MSEGTWATTVTQGRSRAPVLLARTRPYTGQEADRAPGFVDGVLGSPIQPILVSPVPIVIVQVPGCRVLQESSGDVGWMPETARVNRDVKHGTGYRRHLSWKPSATHPTCR
jgi:hypothetical protein